MLILLYGEDTFRSRQKLNQIIEQYKTKHKTGLNLVCFRENSLDFDKVKQTIESVSMFDEKKLLIIENILKNKSFSEEFSKYITKSKLKNNDDVIVVLHQEGKLTSPSYKNKASMVEEFKLLKGIELINWLKKEATKNIINISPIAISKLVAYVGDDLWQLSNELNKLGSYKAGQIIDEQDIDLLVRAKLDTNIFKTIDALARRDKRSAFKFLHQHLEQGENEIYLLTMFTYQLRTLIKLKDLMERGTSYYDLAKKAGLHPFVVQKSSDQLRNFSLDQLKKIYRRLLEIDLGIKKGRWDGPTALDLLIGEI
ncbi:DNA polymerase III subunit delta [Patescibacteria group bacterium]|nr:DNA polymerase III subunit delta [Patescibacteria group bacterium]MBU1563525.1 DNA polymerase III subunit delta [Patescibacteria group bacterium]MBU2068263.1 DNA polymerase III subunit delta [Patescibacteria group bacterium]